MSVSCLMRDFLSDLPETNPYPLHMFEDNFLMLEPSPLYLQACLELWKTAALSGCKLEELGNDYRMY